MLVPMKILPQNIASFIKNPPTAILGVLIYGPDSGLVSENLRLLSQAIVDDIHDPFRVAELSYDSIKDSPALLADELASLSLTGGRRVVRVKDAPASLPTAVQKILENMTGDSLLLITSGELPPTSSLRKFVENAKHLAALPCYKEEGAAIHHVISSHLKQHGFTYDAAVLPLLADFLAGDRLVIMQEVDKLMLYMGTSSHVSADDVLACVGEPLEVSLDAMCADIASGKTADIQVELSRLYRENTSPITIIRAISRYFLRLHQAKMLVVNGTPAAQAIQSLKPPVFFKQVPLFTQQLHKWTPEKLMHAIRSLAQLEAECKKTGQPAQLLCSRLVVLLAHSANR